MNVHIRPALLTDAETLARQNVTLALESEDLKLDYATTLSAVRRIIDNPALGRYYVLEVEGQIACRLFITYEYSDWYDRLYWWIQSVYTEPAHRGQGLYARLYAWMQEQAEAEGVASLRLYFARVNEAAHRVYQKLGMDTEHYIVGISN